MKYLSIRKPRLKTWQVMLSLLTVIVVLGVTVGHIWYNQNLKPVDLVSEERYVFVVEPGSGVAEIAQKLENRGLIKNATAFVWYVRGEEAGVSLQAGEYSLSPSMGVKIIVSILSGGHIRTNQVTILPGYRLDQTRQQLIDAGWTADEVDQALGANYQHSVLQWLPARASLEGYIFPDTYQVDSSTTVKSLIERVLDNFYQKINERDILSKLESQGLDLHQAITLASIVEKEAGSVDEKPIIAQVFLSRLGIDMPLGADPTFLYAAAVTGKPVSVSIDSPYNTRINTGLPPGPIANFNITSLAAVAEPANTSYLYFVTGDDGITRFSDNLDEHQRLTKLYCIERCKLPE